MTAQEKKLQYLEGTMRDHAIALVNLLEAAEEIDYAAAQRMANGILEYLEEQDFKKSTVQP